MDDDKGIHYAETKYGFEYGAAAVERVISHKGRVVLRVKTPTRELEIDVTPKGRIIRVLEPGGEWREAGRPGREHAYREEAS